MDDEVLIIGAGPAGMSAAMELSKANKKFLIVEKQRNQQRVIIKANRENKSFLQLKRIYNIYHL